MLPADLQPGNDSDGTPFFHVFHRRERGLMMMSEVTAPQGAWPLYAEQANLIAAYLKAEAQQSDRAELWDAARASENPDFKGDLFRKEGAFHVEPKQYQAVLRSAAAWLLGVDDR